MQDTKEARLDLAASMRWIGRLGMDEGIANHFSYAVPDRADRPAFLINPAGRQMRYMNASDLLLLDETDGSLVEGEGEPDLSGWNIHSALHRLVPQARAVFHVHSPYATAMVSLKNFRLLPIDQNGARFFERCVYDDDYGGLADNDEEGERIARAFGNDAKKRVMFMANHGVIVTGETIAEAFDNLFYLERACRTYHLALASGQELAVIPDEMAREAARQWETYPNGWENHMADVRRVLDHEEPAYRD